MGELMKHIWAPWRIQYIEMQKPAGCILCSKPKENDDARNYILHRGKENFIILNGYPYNPGHLMIAPYRHVASPEKLSDGERSEHFSLICRSVEVIRQVFKTDGLNVGSNLGRMAGAGIEDHFHTHVVPRWEGDTNFMPVLADAKVLPEMLADTYARLKGRF
jgi:ATP adenylyltransferase